MERLYAENDKIVLIMTGQVLTVHEDLSNHLEPGIVVKEKVGRLIRRCEVRPAGATRQRWELEKTITEKELPPPPPENCLSLGSTPDEPELTQNVATPETPAPLARPLYQRDDKVVLIETGEVLTVLEDLSDRQLGLIVKEKSDYIIMSCDVRPAGQTRERLEAAGLNTAKRG